MALASVPIDPPKTDRNGQPRGGVAHLPVAELAGGGFEALVNQLAVQLGKKASGKHRPVIWMATTRATAGPPALELAWTPFRSGATDSLLRLLGRDWQARLSGRGDGVFSKHAVPLLARGDVKGQVYRLVDRGSPPQVVTGVSWGAGAFNLQVRPVPDNGIETVKVKRSSVEIRYVSAAIGDET